MLFADFSDFMLRGLLVWFLGLVLLVHIYKKHIKLSHLKSPAAKRIGWWIFSKLK